MLQKLIFCTQKVNRANIKRENRKGVEHIVLTSFTLPPNIVMNGGLYPSEEIDKSFESLNRTPVTVEHPEIDGMFVSAQDPEIDFDFRFGAFNENARKTDDGRVALDKVINVQKALKTEKGKRLLDRIEEIETNEKARPIHTSVGVFLDVEDLPEPLNEVNGVKTNAEYSWIGRGMVFDHDAILLDSMGASTPDQGTGIGINSKVCLHNSKQLKVEHIILDDDREVKASNHIKNNELSFHQVENEIHQAINKGLEHFENWVVAVFDDSFIFETKEGEMFRSNYLVDDKDNVSIQDTRLPVERVVEFKSINPTETNEDNAMRDQIIAELGKLGITVNADVSDADLMAKYNEALTANTGDDNADDKEDISSLVSNAVTAALKPLNEKIESLETQLLSNSNKELDDLASVIVNSGKYTGLDVDDVKSFGLDKVKSMAANCGVTIGIGSTMQINNQESDFQVNTKVEDLPE